jgi:DNA-directed RNA polymerase I subunit RPA1
MTAAVEPKTPMMQLPIRKGTSMADIERFCQQSSRLTLSQLIDRIEVRERVQKATGSLVKIFSIQFLFFPLHECFKAHYMGVEQFALALVRLAGILRRDINLYFKRLEKDSRSQAENIGKGSAIRDASFQGEQEQAEEEKGPDDQVSERGDGDADDEKRHRQTQEQTTYDEESGDEEEEKEDEDEDAIEAGTDGENSQIEDEEQSGDSNEAQITGMRDAFAQALPLVPKSFSFDGSGRISFDLEVRLTNSYPQSLIYCV